MPSMSDAKAENGSQARCPLCGYDLSGIDAASNCPECGASPGDRKRDLIEASEVRRTLRVLGILTVAGAVMSTCLGKLSFFPLLGGTLLALGGLVGAFRHGQVLRHYWLWIGLILNAGGLLATVVFFDGW